MASAFVRSPTLLIKELVSHDTESTSALCIIPQNGGMRRSLKLSSFRLNSVNADEKLSVGYFATVNSMARDHSTVLESHSMLTVGDVMSSSKLVTVKADTTVDEALEMLVDFRISGMPVIDDENRLVGVVSDYDLLALDNISGEIKLPSDVFPQADKSWRTFREIQKLLSKNHGKTVADVMTPAPMVVRTLTNLEDAARILLEYKFRMLPVVDDTGRLAGIITRRHVIQAALEIRKAHTAGQLASP